MRHTLKEIAQLAGVSQTTASRVLNGRGEVSPQVRARVEKVIADTGYTPLAAARSLVSQRSGLVGFVMPIHTGALAQDPYFVALLQGLNRASARLGLAVGVFLFDDETDKEGLLERVVGPGRIDGMIMSAYHTREFLIDRLADFSVPVVTMGPNRWPQRFGSVTIDNLEGGRLAGQHLAEIGCRRVALIGGPPDTVSGAERTQGFLQAIEAAGLEISESRIRHGDYTQDSGEAMAAELAAEDFDGIFVANDTMAVGAMRQLQSRGLRIPHDVAMVGFDDLPLAATTDPPLTSISQPIEGIAEAALTMLTDQISDPNDVRSSLLPVHLVRRASTAR